jgi:hypothetical protein
MIPGPGNFADTKLPADNEWVMVLTRETPDHEWLMARLICEEPPRWEDPNGYEVTHVRVWRPLSYSDPSPPTAPRG